MPELPLEPPCPEEPEDPDDPDEPLIPPLDPDVPDPLVPLLAPYPPLLPPVDPPDEPAWLPPVFPLALCPAPLDPDDPACWFEFLSLLVSAMLLSSQGIKVSVIRYNGNACAIFRFRRRTVCETFLMYMTSSTVAWPPPVSRDSRVALVSPSGPVRSESDIVNAEQNARELGWNPVAAANAAKKAAYLAGSDVERALDLNDALQDDSIDAVWCIRGGYGAMRILDNLDYAAFLRKPKALIGYSDITAIHAAIASRCEVVTFHGPTARGKHSEFSRDSFVRAIVHQTDSCGFWDDAHAIRSGSVTARMAGGNLSIVASLVGTPFQIDLKDAILVIEDVNEAVYRVDRMMQQLLMSGSLDNCAAIAGGDFTLPADDTDAVDRSIDDVFGEIAERLGIPCITALPFGHIEDQWTIPLGARARLDAGGKTLNVITPDNGQT